MRLSIDLLQSFIAAAKFGSFSQASRELNKAQSVISTHVATLEDMLDYPLFTRGHKIALTDRGKILLNHAIKIVDDASIFEKRALSLHDIKNPIIHLGIDYSLYSQRLFNLFNNFARTFKDIELKITSLSSFETSLLKDLNIDIALIFNHTHIDSFNVVDIADIENKVAVSKDHALAKETIINRDTLSKYRQIVVESQYEKTQRPILLSPINWKVDSYYYALNLVRSGVGFAVVPTYVVKSDDTISDNIVFLDDTNLNFPDSKLTLVYKDHAPDLEPIMYLYDLILKFAKLEKID